MQNPKQKFGQSSIVFEKPGSGTCQCLQKGVCDYFLFCLDFELFAKTKKDLVYTHSFFTLLLITQYLNKIKKNPAHDFVDITK